MSKDAAITRQLPPAQLGPILADNGGDALASCLVGGERKPTAEGLTDGE